MLKLSCKVIKGSLSVLQCSTRSWPTALEAVREAAPEHCFTAVTELTPLDDVVTGPALRVIDTWTDSDVGAFWMGDAMQRFVVLNGWPAQQRTMPPSGMMS